METKAADNYKLMTSEAKIKLLKIKIPGSFLRQCNIDIQMYSNKIRKET